MKLSGLMDYIENNKLSQSVRTGLVMTIPVLMVGSMALILISLPIPVYQDFVRNIGGGIFYEIFSGVHSVSFNLLSFYITFNISKAYGQLCEKDRGASFGMGITAVACFAVFSGFTQESFDIAYFGAQGMFIAILSAIGASFLYIRIAEHRSYRMRLYADGANAVFNRSLSAIIPSGIVILIFVIANEAMVHIFGIECVQQGFIHIVGSYFRNMGQSLFGALNFVGASSLLWFFGIHGSDVLEGVCEVMFTDGSSIFTKHFLESFVLIGGCGSTMSLLIAVFLFSRRRTSRKLSMIASVPMMFNINELMVFGLPIVLNPVFFLPFLLTPMICTLISYFAMSWGLVPIAVNEVEWTTPVFLSGFITTGSIRGSLLQLVNLGVGVALYRPFIKWYDVKKQHQTEDGLQELTKLFLDADENRVPVTLNDLGGAAGDMAKMLSLDLQYALERKEMELHYQPQHNYDGRFLGSEALLRWNHPTLGRIVPPLIIQLADEVGLLQKLEYQIMQRAFRDVKAISRATGGRATLCVNISGSTLVQPHFADYLRKLKGEEQIGDGVICLEVTERMVLQFNEKLTTLFAEIKDMGFMLAIDDFSMGNTSLNWLQTNQFDLVKLDGSLIKSMMVSTVSRDIVDSILYLGSSLGFTVLAEYVETEEQKNQLHQLGCNHYQGYLYSPALPLAELEQYLGSLDQERQTKKQPDHQAVM